MDRTGVSRGVIGSCGDAQAGRIYAWLVNNVKRRLELTRNEVHLLLNLPEAWELREERRGTYDEPEDKARTVTTMSQPTHWTVWRLTTSSSGW